jgi:hypothetical protein
MAAVQEIPLGSLIMVDYSFIVAVPLCPTVGFRLDAGPSATIDWQQESLVWIQCPMTQRIIGNCVWSVLHKRECLPA